MNKIILKICCMCSLLCVSAFSAFAEDVTQGVVERTDCAAVQAQITELEKVAVLDDAQTAQLSDLQALYRRDCAKRVSGRATGRAARVAVPSDTPAPVAESESEMSVLDRYLAAKQGNCDMLKSEIDRAAFSADVLQQMQAQYDSDCVAAAAASTPQPAVVNDAQTVADNLAAGLCADGTKPNKFGCCTDETFRDMGNAVFACCPKSGGDCFPPMNSGGAL